MTKLTPYNINKVKLYSTIGILIVVVIGITAILSKKKGEVKNIIVEIKHLTDSENDLIKEKDVKELTCPRKYTNNEYPFLGIMGGFHWSYCSVRHFAIYVCRQECFYRASVPAIKRFLGESRQ